MCCATRNRLLEQESNSLFLYDLCQTVYLSPQICIPAGDVDACLSMECCVSVFFRLLSKTHFSVKIKKCAANMVITIGFTHISNALHLCYTTFFLLM